MNFFKKAFGLMQQIGKALMLPVSVLPVAGILLGIGASKYGWIPANADEIIKNSWNIFANMPFWTALGVAILKLMENSGDIIFANMPLIFAIGVALGLTKNDGVSALAAVVGYMVMIAAMGAATRLRGLDPGSTVMGIQTLDTGVFSGILIGLIAGWLFNKYYKISLPPYLGFFAGKRFVPIVTAFAAMLTGIVLSFIWPPVGNIIMAAGNMAANENPSLAASLYGVVERSLLPFGLHHIWNAPFFFQMGSFTAADGTIVHGDITRFFKGDVTAGILGGGFLFKMWGLPAAAIAIWHCAKPENRVKVGGMMVSAALTSFLTGITEPIEFSFLFAAPALYAVHAVLAGSAFYVMNLVGAHMGFTFSQGGIDYLLYFHNDINPTAVLWLGPIYAAIYYIVFRFMIQTFDLKTPGRGDTMEGDAGGSGTGSEKAVKVLQALGGADNLTNLDACITRLRVGLKDIKKASPDTLKALGAAGVVVVDNNLQAIFGTLSENLKSEIEEVIRSGGGEALPTENASDKKKELNAADITPALRSKAEEFAKLAGGFGNISDVHLAAATRAVFTAKDTASVNADAAEKAGFMLMPCSGGRYHLICELQEAAGIAAALKEGADKH